ncbi:MAG TPA: OmpA family protein [Sphingobacteriaceae bacterium]
MFEDEYKEPTRWWIWFLVALAIILTFLVLYSTSPFNFNRKVVTGSVADSTGFAVQNDLLTPVNLSQSEVRFEEITLRDILVRGNDQNAVYTAVLFAPGQAALNAPGRRKLQQIARSVTKRFNNGPLKIYSYADSTGSSSDNLELTRKRAMQVRNWLIQVGGIPAANISIHPQGESSRTSDTRIFSPSDFDRRVEIVASEDRSGLSNTRSR